MAKVTVTYTIQVEVDEDKAPLVEEALEKTAQSFDPNACVDETNCEEVDED